MGRVLIVEDDRAFADALAFSLRLAGHEILVANGAEEGIRLGIGQRPDVVVSDWMLKDDLHGGDVCRRICAVYPDVKTIIMTGYLDIAPEVGRWSEYGDMIIQKPFHKEEILQAVARATSAAAALPSDVIAG